MTLKRGFASNLPPIERVLTNFSVEVRRSVCNAAQSCQSNVNAKNWWILVYTFYTCFHEMIQACQSPSQCLNHILPYLSRAILCTTRDLR